MKEVEVEVKNKAGIHARPSALFVQVAAEFDSEITVISGVEEINGKSIMGLMLLAAEHNGGASLLQVEDLEVGTGLIWGTHERAPKAKLNVKEFNKLEIKAIGGKVICQESQLQTEISKGNISTIAIDGAKIH